MCGNVATPSRATLRAVVEASVDIRNTSPYRIPGVAMRSNMGCLVVPLREQSWVFDGRPRVGIIPNRKGGDKILSMPSVLRVGKLHGDALTAFELQGNPSLWKGRRVILA